MCQPGATQPCYTGPAGTEGVGQCVGGTATCLADASGFGPCEGEVLPGVESCTTPGDEDCDGLVDEEGADCVCVPGEQSACYTGPAGTENVGPCKGGMQVCNADGKSWGECVGQVLPVAEDCTTGEDEDCSGEANAEVDGCVCPPAGQTQCYTGPDGTKGVGICVGGVKTCADDGKSWGVCEGEVLPSAESCEVDGDEDCDGVSNEAEAGCVSAGDDEGLLRGACRNGGGRDMRSGLVDVQRGRQGVGCVRRAGVACGGVV